MTKTLENRCTHKVLKFIGMQEFPRHKIKLGNCYYCHSTRSINMITDKFLKEFMN